MGTFAQAFRLGRNSGKGRAMGKPKNDHLTDQPMPSPTWKPDPKKMDLDPKPVADGKTKEADRPPADGGKSEAEKSEGSRSR